MNKFKTCQAILLLSCEDNNILDQESVPFYDCCRLKKSRFRLSYDVFDLENMNSADCKVEFRLHKADLPRLADALYSLSVLLQTEGLEGLCVLLRQTYYPCRLIQRCPKPN